MDYTGPLVPASFPAHFPAPNPNALYSPAWCHHVKPQAWFPESSMPETKDISESLEWVSKLEAQLHKHSEARHPDTPDVATQLLILLNQCAVRLLQQSKGSTANALLLKARDILAATQLQGLQESPLPPAAKKSLVALTYSNFGCLMMFKKKLHDALVFFDESLKLEPDSPVTLSNRSAVLLNLGYHTDALLTSNMAYAKMAGLTAVCPVDFLDIDNVRQKVTLFHQMGLAKEQAPPAPSRAPATASPSKDLHRLAYEMSQFELGADNTVTKVLASYTSLSGAPVQSKRKTSNLPIAAGPARTPRSPRTSPAKSPRKESRMGTGAAKSPSKQSGRLPSPNKRASPREPRTRTSTERLPEARSARSYLLPALPSTPATATPLNPLQPLPPFPTSQEPTDLPAPSGEGREPVQLVDLRDVPTPPLDHPAAGIVSAPSSPPSATPSCLIHSYSLLQAPGSSGLSTPMAMDGLIGEQGQPLVPHPGGHAPLVRFNV